MTVKVIQRRIADPQYPVLKIDRKGVVVLFTGRRTGTVVNEISFHVLGEHRSDWNETNFSLYRGTITLENE